MSHLTLFSSKRFILLLCSRDVENECCTYKNHHMAPPKCPLVRGHVRPHECNQVSNINHHYHFFSSYWSQAVYFDWHGAQVDFVVQPSPPSLPELRIWTQNKQNWDFLCRKWNWRHRWGCVFRVCEIFQSSEFNLLSHSLFLTTTPDSDRTRAIIPISDRMLIIINDFSKAVRLGHQFGFLKKFQKEKMQLRFLFIDIDFYLAKKFLRVVFNRNNVDQHSWIQQAAGQTLLRMHTIVMIMIIYTDTFSRALIL